MHKTVYIFAGPSLYGTPYQGKAAAAAADDADVKWLPPARRGDIEALTSTHQQPGVIALADGTFHAYPSVCHIELREAIAAGWLVYGMCSMGAIRACEMAHMGMLPWGRVAAMFCAAPGTADDEVALVHSAEEPFLPLSEPMVHIQEFLTRMHTSGLLERDQATAVAQALRNRWYGDRTLANLRSLLVERLADPVVTARIDQELANFGRYRLKQQDLVSFVTVRPWQAVDKRPADAHECPALT